MSSEAKTEHQDLHKSVVTGVVRIIKQLAAAPPKASIPIQDLVKTGFEGISEEAQTYVFEFIKDGIIDLQPDQIRQVAAGDYSFVWVITNAYLRNFGYDPVDPVEINP